MEQNSVLHRDHPAISCLNSVSAYPGWKLELAFVQCTSPNFQLSNFNFPISNFQFQISNFYGINKQ